MLNKMLKVMLIPEFGEFGGVFEYFKALLNYYVLKNYEIILILNKNQISKIINTQLNSQLYENPLIKIYEITDNGNFELKLKRKFIFNIIFDLKRNFKIFKKEKPDLIVVSTGSPGSLLGLILLNTKFIYICHSYPVNGRKYSFKNIVLNIFLSSEKRIITVSNFAKNNFIKFWNLKKKSNFISVIHNTVFTKPSTMKEDFEKNENKISSKHINILTLGHVRWYKNPEAWVNVIKIFNLNFKNEDVRFLWAGEGELLEEYRNKLKELDIKNAIFLGLVDNVEELYSKSLIYFQPSLIESHSISTIDAMKHGIPCVVSKIGGLPESVVDGETGFVIDVGNHEEMADKLILLIKDKSLREKMGLASRNIFEEKFSYKGWLDKMDLLHNDVLNLKF